MLIFAKHQRCWRLLRNVFLSTLDLHDLPCLISRTFDHFCSAHSAAIVLCLLCRISILQRVCSVSIVCSATHLPWTPEKKKASRFRSHRLVIPITSKTQTQGMEETYNRKPSLLRSVLLPLTPEKRASRFRSLRSYSVSPPKHKPKVIEETDYREPSLLRSVHQTEEQRKTLPPS